MYRKTSPDCIPFRGWRSPELAATLEPIPRALPESTPEFRRASVISIVIPAKNEAAALESLLPRLRAAQPNAEILVVDDGSTDATAEICARHAVTVLRQPYSMGNGAAIKHGARAARGDTLVFMDADGQHDPADIARLAERIEAGFDM